jgi:hypothetical protein
MIGGMVFGAGLHALGAGLRDASSTSLDEMVEAEAAKANGEAGTGFWKDSGLLSGKAAMRTRGVVKKVPLFGDFLGGLADFGSLGAREGLEEAMAMEQRAKNMKALKEGFRGAGLSAAGIGKEDQLAFTDKMAAAQRGLVGDAKELFVLDQQRARLLKDAADAAREQHELMRGQGATAKMLTDAHQKHHGLLTQLATVEARRLDIMRQQSKEALEQQKADIMGKLSGVQSGLAGEDARLMAMQERFGEMSAEERSRVFDVGRRFRAGGLGAISDEERGVIQPFMGDQLQSAFRARGADPFARLMQEFGLGVRREELRQQEKMLLEAKITIENKLKAEIDINGRAVAEQLQQSLLPQIIKTMQDMNAAVSADFARRAFQVRAGNAAANPP